MAVIRKQLDNTISCIS